eukprot:5621311-Amphidinium_carterae.1
MNAVCSCSLCRRSLSSSCLKVSAEILAQTPLALPVLPCNAASTGQRLTLLCYHGAVQRTVVADSSQKAFHFKRMHASPSMSYYLCTVTSEMISSNNQQSRYLKA